MKDIKEIFNDYLTSQEDGTPLWYSVLEYAQILAESADRDFKKFCAMYDQYVLAHGERYSDGAMFVFDLTDDYTLYLSTVEYKVEGLKVEFKPIESVTETL